MISDSEFNSIKHDAVIKGLTDKANNTTSEVKQRLGDVYLSEKNYLNEINFCINKLNECVQIKEEVLRLQKEFGR